MWRIPLQSRVGTGYVFSRAHVSEDEAAATLIARSGLTNKRAADPRALKIRIGRRTKFWIGNCVSIGLSSGFVEPLESTGIHLIFKAIKLLLEFWPDLGFPAVSAAAYNDEMAATFDEVRDFIMLHYALAGREEPFWRDARAAPRERRAFRGIALYDESGRVRLGSAACVFRAELSLRLRRQRPPAPAQPDPRSISRATPSALRCWPRFARKTRISCARPRRTRISWPNSRAARR